MSILPLDAALQKIAICDENAHNCLTIEFEARTDRPLRSPGAVLYFCINWL